MSAWLMTAFDADVNSLYRLAPYLAVPVIVAAVELMQLTFGWASGYEQHGTVGTLVTTLHVFVPHNASLVAADLALFWALLLASRTERMWAKMALGIVILVPSQAEAVLAGALVRKQG